MDQNQIDNYSGGENSNVVPSLRRFGRLDHNIGRIGETADPYQNVRQNLAETLYKKEQSQPTTKPKSLTLEDLAIRRKRVSFLNSLSFVPKLSTPRRKV
jgi:hypothetical protein